LKNRNAPATELGNSMDIVQIDDTGFRHSILGPQSDSTGICRIVRVDQSDGDGFTDLDGAIAGKQEDRPLPTGFRKVRPQISPSALPISLG